MKFLTIPNLSLVFIALVYLSILIFISVHSVAARRFFAALGVLVTMSLLSGCAGVGDLAKLYDSLPANSFQKVGFTINIMGFDHTLILSNIEKNADGTGRIGGGSAKTTFMGYGLTADIVGGEVKGDPIVPKTAIPTHSAIDQKIEFRPASFRLL